MSDPEIKQPEDKPAESYEAVRPFFKASFEQILVAGRGVREMAEFTLERLGDAALPHLQRFMNEVRAGQVKVKGLTQSVHDRIFGAHPSPEERERWIREAAYLRAQQRGFAGGSPEQDWYEAEKEVDARLAAELGLIGRGRRALESVASAAEREIEETYDLVRQWLARQGEAVKAKSSRARKTKATDEAKTSKEKPAKEAKSKAVKAEKEKAAETKADKPKKSKTAAKDGEAAKSANRPQEP